MRIINKSRLLSLCLALSLIISVFSGLTLSAYANEQDVQTEQEIQEEQETTGEEVQIVEVPEQTEPEVREEPSAEIHEDNPENPDGPLQEAVQEENKEVEETKEVGETLSNAETSLTIEVPEDDIVPLTIEVPENDIVIALYLDRPEELELEDGTKKKLTPEESIHTFTVEAEHCEDLLKDAKPEDIIAGYEGVADGECHVFSFAVSGGTGTMEWQWFKKSDSGDLPVALEEGTDKPMTVLSVSEPEDSGLYYLELRFTDNGEVLKRVRSNIISVVITKPEEPEQLPENEVPALMLAALPEEQSEDKETIEGSTEETEDIVGEKTEETEDINGEEEKTKEAESGEPEEENTETETESEVPTEKKEENLAEENPEEENPEEENEQETEPVTVPVLAFAPALTTAGTPSETAIVIEWENPDEVANYTYDGKEKKPGVKVKLEEGGTVIDPEEYTVSYSKNTDAGEDTASVSVESKETAALTFSGTKAFSIKLASPVITLKDKSAYYNRKEITIGSAEVKTADGGKYAGTVTYHYYTDSGCTTELSTAPVGAGTYYVVAETPAFRNHTAGKSNVAKLVIIYAAKTVSASTSASAAYVASSKTVEIIYGESYTFSAKVTQTGYYIGRVYVNGINVGSPNQYSDGTYYYTYANNDPVEFTKAEKVSVVFQVYDSYGAPATGDSSNIALTTWILTVSGAALVLGLNILRKKRI